MKCPQVFNQYDIKNCRKNIKSVSYTKVLRLHEYFLRVLAKNLTESLFNSSTLSRAFLSTHIIIFCDSPISSAFY